MVEFVFILVIFEMNLMLLFVFKSEKIFLIVWFEIVLINLYDFVEKVIVNFVESGVKLVSCIFSCVFIFCGILLEFLLFEILCVVF